MLCLVSFRSPPEGARIRRPPDVIITNLCLFFVLLAPKKRENLLGASNGGSAPFLEVGLCGAGVELTTNCPSFNIRSFALVRTGDQSMSSCVGGARSVMIRGCGRMGRVVGAGEGCDVIMAGALGVEALARSRLLSITASWVSGLYALSRGDFCFHNPLPHCIPSKKGCCLMESI